MKFHSNGTAGIHGPLELILRDPRFWVLQLVVVSVAATHDWLERILHFTGAALDLLPVAIYWLPLVYAALIFGFRGSVITSVVVLLGSLPNWLMTPGYGTHVTEIFMVLVAVVASDIIGLQVNRVRKAQRKAREYAADALRSHEEERRRLSIELHDDPVQALIAVVQKLDQFKHTSSLSQAELLDVRKGVIDIIAKLRDVSKELRFPVLDDMGLVSALRVLMSGYQEKGMFDCQIEVSGEPRRFARDSELTLFRIAQESLRNVEKHAKASRVILKINFTGKEVVMEVLDNGVGFNVAESLNRTGGHFGIVGMRERSDMVGAKFEVSSRPGTGTRVTVLLPVPEDNPLARS